MNHSVGQAHCCFGWATAVQLGIDCSAASQLFDWELTACLVAGVGYSIRSWLFSRKLVVWFGTWLSY